MSDVVIYNDGEIELEISLEKDSIWLIANDIANIFDVNRPAIVKHIGNIYKSEELSKDLTCSILEQVALDGKKRKINYYNLDIIISVGYKVNSKKATKFRQWATSVLKSYITNGYTINSDKNSHDRFMIVDNIDVYHIFQTSLRDSISFHGASLKDLGKKWFAFSRFDVEAFWLLGRLR
jgi:hypothetical protein